MSRLKDKYVSEVVPALQKRFNYNNVMEIPHLEKVVVNMGLGDAKAEMGLSAAAHQAALAKKRKKPSTGAKGLKPAK